MADQTENLTTALLGEDKPTIQGIVSDMALTGVTTTNKLLTQADGGTKATQSEANIGTDDIKFITPLTLTALDEWGKYLPFTGGTMTGNLKVITPVAGADAASKDYVDGLTTIATQAEVDTGTEAVKNVTPATLANSTQWDDKVVTDPTAIAGATTVTNMVQMTQAAYDTLGTYDSSTFYVITV